MKTELSPKQKEVARLVRLALSDKEIANELCISEETVDFHLRMIFRKLQIHSRTELAVHPYVNA